MKHISDQKNSLVSNGGVFILKKNLICNLWVVEHYVFSTK